MRSDRREADQLRKIQVNRDFMKHAEGSCLICVGDTKVVCTATVDKNVPLFLKGSGKGWITAEYSMLPRSTQNRIPRGKISGRDMEIQRLVGRALRSVVNCKNLGERTIYLDCDVIQADGGTRIASVIGGFIAMVDGLHSLVKQQIISSIPITDYLGAVSVGVLHGKYLLDLNFQEDSNAEVDMNVVMKSSGDFVEVQGTGERGSFSQKDLNSLLDLAKKGISEIIDIERNLFKDIL